MNRRKIILAIASLFMLSAMAFAKSDTYIYDYWGEIEKSPDVYRVSHVLYADDLNLEVGLRNPQGLFCKGNLVYVLDTDNNRIIELEYTQKKQVELIVLDDEPVSLGNARKLRKSYIWSKKIRLAVYKIITYLPKLISGNYKKKASNEQ